MPIAIVPRVADVSHYNVISDLAAAKAFGIRGLIHKVTQGTSYVDKTYRSHRQMARDQGLLWGAYHFNTGEKVQDQVDHFLDAAFPDGEDIDDETLLCLDFEDNEKSNMSVAQAAEFIETLKSQIDRSVVLYSGNRTKHLLANAPADIRAIFAECKFWLCQYGAVPKMVDDNGKPLPWGPTPWLWQYTGDGLGPTPHGCPGISIPGHAGIDLNHFFGTEDELAEQWASS